MRHGGRVGEAVSADDLAAFEGRVVALGRGKFLISGFVEFQYGKFSSKSNVHASVLRILEQYGLSWYSDKGKYPTASLGIASLEASERGTGTPKEKDKVKDKDKDIERGAGENLPECEMHTSVPESKISDLTLAAEKIRMAYPRQGDVPQAQAAILRALRHGTNAETMLAQTQSCAVWVRKLQAVDAHGFIPGAKAFFEGEQWPDELKFKGIWQRHEQERNKTNGTHQQVSGNLNAPGRYAKKPAAGGEGPARS
jgi:hypothetical protein